MGVQPWDHWFAEPDLLGTLYSINEDQELVFTAMKISSPPLWMRLLTTPSMGITCLGKAPEVIAILVLFFPRATWASVNLSTVPQLGDDYSGPEGHPRDHGAKMPISVLSGGNHAGSAA